VSRPFPLQNCPFSWGDRCPHLTHGSLIRPPSPQPKRHIDQFSHFCTTHGRVSLYFAMGHPFPPQNCPFPWGDLDPHLIHGSLGTPKPKSIGASIFAGLTTVTDRQTDWPTDRPCYSVCNNRPYLADAAMRPNNTSSLYEVEIFILNFTTVGVIQVFFTHLLCAYFTSLKINFFANDVHEVYS